PVHFKEKTAVELVGAILGHNLNLSATVATILGVVIIAHGFGQLDRFGIRGHDGSAVPRHAVNAHTVERDTVGIGASARSADLGAIFGRIHTSRGTRAPGPLVAGYGLRIPTAIARTVAKK